MRAVFPVLIFVLLFSSTARAVSLYPVNPFPEGDAVFISSAGVARYDAAGEVRRWHALDGVHTFAPVVERDFVLIGTSQGLFALDKNNGTIRWHVMEADTVFSPSIDNGVAYAGSRSGTLYAFSLLDGRVLWSQHSDGWVYSPALIAGLAISGGQAGVLRAYDRRNGIQQWAQEMPGELVFSPVAGIDGSLLLTTFAGDVVSLDATNGQLIWRTETATANDSPVVLEGKLFATGYGGTVRRFDPNNGRLLWSTPLSGRIAPAQTIINEEILFGSDQGFVHWLNIETGYESRRTATTGMPVGSPYQHDGRVIQWLHFQDEQSRLHSITVDTE